jgi:uncharacterized membrane protein YczE
MSGRGVRPEFQVLGFPSRAELVRRLPRLLVGIVCLGVGISLMVQARLGLSPWDVLHQGISEQTGLEFGTVVIVLGLAILPFWVPLGQRFGIGTVINVLTVGVVVNLTIHALPVTNALVPRWGYLLGGILVIGFGTGLYIGAGLGPGPRDGLMTGIAAKGPRLWIVRTCIELTVLCVGWILGGDVGIGTLLFAFGIGPLAHYFLARLHLGVGGLDPDPDAAYGE